MTLFIVNWAAYIFLQLCIGVFLYRCGFVAGAEAADKHGLPQVMKWFEERKWRLGI